MQKFFLGLGLAGTLFLVGCGSLPHVEETALSPGEALLDVDVPETGVAAVDAEVRALIAQKTEEVEMAADELDQIGSAAHAGLVVTSKRYTAAAPDV